MGVGASKHDSTCPCPSCSLLFCRDLPDNLKLVWDSILFLTSCWITFLVFASSVGVIFSLLAAIVSVEAARLGSIASSSSVGSGAPSSLAPCSRPGAPFPLSGPSSNSSPESTTCTFNWADQQLQLVVTLAPRKANCSSGNPVNYRTTSEEKIGNICR